MSQQENIPVGKLAIGIAAGFGTIVAVVFVVIFISRLGLDDHHGSDNVEEVSARIKPVGQVNLGSVGQTMPTAAIEKTTAPTPAMTASSHTPVAEPTTTQETAPAPASSVPFVPDLAKGEQIYGTACALCHAQGIAGAPFFGDKEAWAPRVAKGLEALYASALQGLGAMPPKAGQMGLPDGDIKSAAAYMISQVSDIDFSSMGNKPEPATTPVAESTTPPETTPAQASSDPFVPDLAKGEQIYGTACALCHAQGIAGAPLFGNKEAWAPRVAKGMDALYATSLQGLGAMPPKGGQISLPDEDIKSAVAYMVSKVSDIGANLSTDEEIKVTTKPAVHYAQGENIYQSSCANCHAMGIVGAPRFGDKENWTPRLTKGMDTLFANALQGFRGETGVMPAKGGQIQLPNENVKAAVTYMVSKVQ